MIKVEDILEMWKRDSLIDEMNLDESSRDSAKMHSKYLELLTTSRLQLKRKEMQQQTLLKDKWSYYTGTMTKQEMDDRGWDYDPYKGGKKPLKSDLDYFFESDPDLQRNKAQIDYIKITIETLESIMTNISWRHQNIKNIIEWRKFTSGV